jgi:hypothetical protein
VARIEWIEQRLQNWARWTLNRGGGALGFAAVDLADSDAGRDGYAEAAIPTSDVEAAETDDAIARLYPGGLALAVREFYVGRGGVKDKALRLCIGESTLYARVDQAHRQLAEHFLAQQDRQRAERARVEAMQTSVRPR